MIFLSSNPTTSSQTEWETNTSSNISRIESPPPSYHHDISGISSGFALTTRR
jgi:hypothetical protein